MQVRDRRTLGMDFHLTRLERHARALRPWPRRRPGPWLHQARARDDIEDASVRVNVFRAGADDDVSVMVGVRPPASAPTDPQRLQTVAYRRPHAHIKHAVSFGQSYHGGLAHGNGFDEALFVGPDGSDLPKVPSPTSGSSIGEAIVWPDGPALRGIMMQVLQRELDRTRRPWRCAAVRVADLESFDGAFVTDSHGIAGSRRSTTGACPWTRRLCMWSASSWPPPPTTRSDRVLVYDRAMNPPRALADVRSLLEAPAPAVLVTYRRDGSADVSPVWFRFTGEAFEVVVAKSDVKLRHLTKDRAPCSWCSRPWRRSAV